MKKMLFLLCAAVLCMLCAAAPAEEMHGTCGENVAWSYDPSSFTLTITGTGVMDYFINSQSGDSKETPWESFKTSIVHVDIQSGVTHVGACSFRYCTAMKKATLGSSVIDIGERAFYGCRALNDVSLPSGMEVLGQSAFSGCSSLAEIQFPDNLSEIGEDAFYRTALTSVDLPASVKAIRFGVFSYCTSLQAVSLPEQLEAIEGSAFSGCSSLLGISLPDRLKNIGQDAFYNCNAMTGEIRIPGSVETIGQYAFYGCGMTGLIIEEGVRETDAGPFRSCLKLETVSLPGSLTVISEEMFDNCWALTEVEIPSGVQKIGNSAFSGCSALRRILLPEGLLVIAANAFANCTSLQSMDLPSTIDEIGYHSFYSCTSLTRLYIPASLNTLNTSFVEGCTALERIDVDPGSGWLESEDGVLYSKGKTDLICCPQSAPIEHFTVPEGVMAIRANAFSGHSFIRSITFPDTLKSVGSYAFANCISLQSPDLPESIESIGNYAFYHCESFDHIALPDTTTSIGQWAFANCSNLERIRLSENLSTIPQYAFSGCTCLREIDIPASVTMLYACAFAHCPNLEKVSFFNRGKSIQNLSCFDNVESSSLILYCYRDSSVRSAAEKYGFPYRLLDTVDDLDFDFCLPAELVEIQSEAFLGIHAQSVRLNETVQSIGSRAFAEAAQLQSVYIPDSAAAIAQDAFQGVSGLTVYGHAGSAAQSFAESAGYTFVEIDHGVNGN